MPRPLGTAFDNLATAVGNSVCGYMAITGGDDPGNYPQPVQAYGIQLFSAFAIYLLFSIYFFGIPIIFHPTRIYLGKSADPTISLWALVWWPYSFLHHLNPFLPRVVFAPAGYNLAWAAGLPGPSLLAYPITRWLGPVAAYNVLCLLAPASAAWAAFLLCRHITGRFWPALLGGYVFGFSSYIAGEMLDHLCFALIFPIPLMVLLVLLELDQKISRPRFIALLAPLLIFEFLTSMELFATTTIVGALVIVLGLLILQPDRRLAVWHSLALIAYAYLVSLLFLSPYLYFVFMKGEPSPINSALQFSADLLNLILPTRMTLIGSTQFANFNGHFAPGLGAEATSYLGIPLLAVLVLFALSYWSRRSSKIMVLALIAVWVASLGPVLHIAGEPSRIILPWALCLHLPLIDQVLPARLSMYSFLIAGIMAAFYLSDHQHHWAVRAAMGVLVVIFLLPNVPLLRKYGNSNVDTPAFFRDGIYKRYLDKNDIVLILPFNSNEQMLWQAQTRMYFSMAGGYFGPDPPGYTVWPVVRDLRMERPGVDFAEQLEGFLGAHRVKAIIVDARAQAAWLQRLSVLNVAPVAAGGVFFYKVPSTVLATYKDASPIAFEAKYAWLLFLTAVSGAQRYLAAGLPLSQLTPWEAEQRGLLMVPKPAQSPPWDPRWQGDLWLGTYSGHDIGVGVMGSYASVKPLLEKFSAYASQIYFPYPRKVSGDPKTNTRGQLLMVFTPAQLANAARVAGSLPYPDTAPSPVENSH